MHINESNFIDHIKKKNPRALEFVVDNYSNLVFKIAHHILNTGFHSQYVEECANEVFWAVWSNIDSFDQERGTFKYWIAAIAKYKAIDYKRKLYQQSTAESIDQHSPAHGASIEQIIITKENRAELLQAINHLNDEDREIFIRRYFLHEGIENIATSFGVDRNLVDQRLSRGRRFLREKLTSLRGGIY